MTPDLQRRRMRDGRDRHKMKVYSLDIKEALCKLSYRNQYDVIANEVAREIFEAVVSGKTNFSKEYPKHKIQVKANVNKVSDEYIEKVKGIKYVTFDVGAYNVGGFVANSYTDCEVVIEITLAKSFSPKDYQSLNYTLYDAVRHEIEHKETFSNIGQPDEDYISLFNKVFKKKDLPLLDHCKLMSQYLLNPQELPSYSKAIYYLSKKQGKNFRKVIEETVVRCFFNNEPETMTNGLNDPGISKLFVDVIVELEDSINKFYPRSKVKMVHI